MLLLTVLCFPMVAMAAKERVGLSCGKQYVTFTGILDDADSAQEEKRRDIVWTFRQEDIFSLSLGEADGAAWVVVEKSKYSWKPTYVRIFVSIETYFSVRECVEDF